MKKIKTLAIVFLLIGIVSCGNPNDLNKSFYGGVVLGKCQNAVPQYFLTVNKTDSTFVTIQVYPSYYEYYQAGDTIK